MVKKISAGVIVSGIITVLISCLVFADPTELKQNVFFEGKHIPYKIAYQNKKFSVREDVPDPTFEKVSIISNENYERIDIILSNFDGSDKVVLTENIKPGENIAFLRPRWSPDSKKIAFFSVLYKREENSTIKLSYDIDIWIIKQDGSGYKKVWSYKVSHKSASDLPYIFNYGIRWSKDSSKLLTRIDDTSEKEKMRGRLGTSIVINLSDLSSCELEEGELQNFQGPWGFDIISPDGNHKVFLTHEKDYGRSSISIGEAAKGEILSKILPKGENAVYVKREGFPRKKKIFSGLINRIQWSPDGEFVILFLADTGEHFYIADLEGNSCAIKGEYPCVQPFVSLLVPR